MPASVFLRPYAAEMATFTDAPDIYHHASALTCLGALLTRTKYRTVLYGGVPPRWTNLWTILVGDAGLDRKSTAVNMAAEIIQRMDPDLVAPSEGSPEGFLANLERREVNAQNPSTIIIQSEFSKLLQQFQTSYSQSMKPLLMDFYDVPGSFKRSLVKKTFTLTQPRVSMLGGIAIELLPNLTSPADWLGGFFSRCMLISGKKTRALEAAGDVDEEVYDRYVKKLNVLLREWRNSQIKLRRPRFMYSTAAKQIVRGLPKLPEEPNLKLSLSRASTHLQKVAAIEQIDEDPTAPEIGKAAAERALVFIMHWWDTVPAVIDECFARGRADLEGDRLAKRIHRYILKKGGKVRARDVLRNCALRSDELDRSLRSLQEAELVRLFQDRRGATWLEHLKDDPNESLEPEMDEEENPAGPERKAS